MNSLSDQDLLCDYAARRSEAAFAELVRRHIDIVYSAALRMVRDAHLAEDVTQGVFVALAQGASQLTGRSVLTGWLHRTAQNLAANAVRSDVRRRAREQEAAAMNELLAAEPEAAWNRIAPHLDAALGELSEPERDALMLRYFQGKSAREIAALLGTSDVAAQKRVSRAVERLREIFARQGVTVGASGLVILLSAHAVQAAPAGLAAAVAAAAVPSAATFATAVTLTKAIAMTTLQKTVITVTIAAALGAGLYEASQAAAWRSQVQTLREQQAPLAEQVQQLTRERDEAANRLALLRDASQAGKSNSAELLRLRGEVSRLQNNALPSNIDPAASVAKSWLARVSQLKERLQQTPGAKIPEFQFLTEQDWLNAAKGDLNTDEDYRRALSGLRSAAESTFITTVLKPALNQYEQANQGQFPASISQLQPYFNPPVDDLILQRWEVAPKSAVPSLGLGDSIITQIAAVDADYDTRFGIGPNGSGSAGPQDWDAPGTGPSALLMPAIKAYAAANNGRQPTDLSELAPYLTTPEEQAALQLAIKRSSR